mmetsp:Transcript_2922/g.7619  ORF Transcript_2922/g.7619 Transcript_2922/m.7619 type:complete len:205 (+) Transcript_2922:2298-2912(+)
MVPGIAQLCPELDQTCQLPPNVRSRSWTPRHGPKTRTPPPSPGQAAPGDPSPSPSPSQDAHPSPSSCPPTNSPALLLTVTPWTRPPKNWGAWGDQDPRVVCFAVPVRAAPRERLARHSCSFHPCTQAHWTLRSRGSNGNRWRDTPTPPPACTRMAHGLRSPWSLAEEWSTVTACLQQGTCRAPLQWQRQRVGPQAPTALRPPPF